ncbi:MAG TPA: hypothetical protein PKH24_02875 [Sedimentisphaerales bacterium]|jgi:hypothetical protein|nr:hypothetical protein [Sedimentisphaerales bacterium]HNU28000.1 hypothetical protein [Sedimentisphaerales bacterium]
MQHRLALVAIVGLLIVGAMVSSNPDSHESHRNHFEQPKLQEATSLAAEEEDKPTPANQQTIGYWLDERPGVASRITIFQKEGKLFVERRFKDGSSLKKEIVEKRSPLGRRFDYADGSTHGDHYALGSSGDLQLRDTEGLISIARKMK